MIVVDTNVMVYLLTGTGPWEDAARLLRADPEWAEPPILLSELRNVVVGLTADSAILAGAPDVAVRVTEL